ncbi:hypothetical protein GCM10009077_20710 [Roseibium denhamense]
MKAPRAIGVTQSRVLRLMTMDPSAPPLSEYLRDFPEPSNGLSQTKAVPGYSFGEQSMVCATEHCFPER